MTTIAPINIASSTGSNWLAEAQSALSASSGGLLGTLQSASLDSSIGSVRSFLNTSQANADAFASIAQSTVQAAGQFYAQVAAAQGQQAAADRAAFNAKLLNPGDQTNHTPGQGLPSVLFYDNNSSLDTTTNIMTLTDGSQVDVTTGLPYIDPKNLIRMANGAYLDTKNNVLHEPDGTVIDANTGLDISTRPKTSSSSSSSESTGDGSDGADTTA